ncbi:Uncharacterised protein [Legionella geestiana]|nr:Uncharacterised protein [Legionella geestiana]
MRPGGSHILERAHPMVSASRKDCLSALNYRQILRNLLIYLDS